MIDRVPAAKEKDWDEPATMTDVFRYYSEGLHFSGRAWRRATIATWIAVFASITSVSSIIVIISMLL